MRSLGLVLGCGRGRPAGPAARGSHRSPPPTPQRPDRLHLEEQLKERLVARRERPASATIESDERLVVDDDRDVREALRRALTLAGYEVPMADGGAEAIEHGRAGGTRRARARRRHAGDGRASRCAGRPRLPGSRVPILMLTARDDIEDRVAGLDAGADDYREAVRQGRAEGALARAMRRTGPDGEARSRAIVRGAQARDRAPRREREGA